MGEEGPRLMSHQFMYVSFGRCGTLLKGTLTALWHFLLLPEQGTFSVLGLEPRAFRFSGQFPAEGATTALTSTPQLRGLLC